MLNQHLECSTQENMQEEPDSEQIFTGIKDKKLVDISLTRDMVMKERGRLKKFNSPGSD